MTRWPCGWRWRSRREQLPTLAARANTATPKRQAAPAATGPAVSIRAGSGRCRSRHRRAEAAFRRPRAYHWSATPAAVPWPRWWRLAEPTSSLRLVTIAGNLDPLAWTAYQRVQPLTSSLSPISYIEALSAIPQWHYVGAMDDNITPLLVQGFAAHFPANQRPVVRIESKFDHHCCWVDQWPRLWQESLAR